MKVVVMSDIHGDEKRFARIVAKHKEDADYIISLGDSELKQKRLLEHDVLAIKGNYPFDAGFTREHVMEIAGRRLLLTHGHRYRVKTGYESLYHRMLDIPVDIALHGHTHNKSFKRIREKFVLNPGAVGDLRNEGSTYMVMRFMEETVEVDWMDTDTHEMIDHEVLPI